MIIFMNLFAATGMNGMVLQQITISVADRLQILQWSITGPQLYKCL